MVTRLVSALNDLSGLLEEAGRKLPNWKWELMLLAESLNWNDWQRACCRSEEEHKAVNTKDPAQVKNLVQWILAQ